MGWPKWKGAVGIVRTADASSTGTPFIYPVAGSANIVSRPVVNERVPAIRPDVYDIQASGFDHSFTADDIQVNAKDIGYLLALALGSDVWTTSHAVQPADDSQYLHLALDRGLDLDTVTGGEQPTQNLVGCKIGALSIDQPSREYAKVAVSGFGCDLAAPSTGIAGSATIPTGADNQPLSWEAMRGANGYFKIGYDGGAVADDDQIQGFKLDYKREQVYAGINLNTNQPTAINEGARELTFEVTREFTGSGAQSDYDAFINQKLIGIEVKYAMGTTPYSVLLQVPQARIVDSYPQEVGAGAESMMGTLVCKAFRGVGALLSGVIADGTTAAYWT